MSIQFEIEDLINRKIEIAPIQSCQIIHSSTNGIITSTSKPINIVIDDIESKLRKVQYQCELLQFVIDGKITSKQSSNILDLLISEDHEVSNMGQTILSNLRNGLTYKEGDLND